MINNFKHIQCINISFRGVIAANKFMWWDDQSSHILKPDYTYENIPDTTTIGTSEAETNVTMVTDKPSTSIKTTVNDKTDGSNDVKFTTEEGVQASADSVSGKKAFFYTTKFNVLLMKKDV